MAHISIEQSGVGAQYTALDTQDIVIELDDASYAKAERVMFNPDTNAIHAVMHEGVFFIGTVPQDWANKICESKKVILSAQHYSGAVLRLNADVVCVN
ncbi:MAG: hypothetical protein ACRBDI_08745 [Alphaproteobacteria bacterium]